MLIQLARCTLLRLAYKRQVNITVKCNWCLTHEFFARDPFYDAARYLGGVITSCPFKSVLNTGFVCRTRRLTPKSVSVFFRHFNDTRDYTVANSLIARTRQKCYEGHKTLRNCTLARPIIISLSTFLSLLFSCHCAACFLAVKRMTFQISSSEIF